MSDINQHRRRILQTILAAGLLPALPACTARPSTLRLAGNEWLGFQLLFMAQGLGYTSKLPLHLQLTTSSTDTIAMLQRGEIDGAMITLDEALALCVDKVPIKVVLLFNVSLGADVVLAKASIQQASDLRGRRIGMEAGSLGRLMLDALLEYAELEMDEVEIVYLSPEQHHYAWQHDEVDALICYEPLASQMLSEAGWVIFDSRMIPDRIFDVLVVTEQTIKQHTKTLRGVVAAYFQALHHFRSNPVDASHRLGHLIGMPSEDVLRLFRGLFLPDERANLEYLSTDDTRIRLAASELLARLYPAEAVAGCEVAGLFDNRFIPRVQAW